MTMDDAERRAIEWECAQNTIRFYNRLDAVRGDDAAQLFAADGIWYKMNSDDGHVGREAIAAYVNKVRQRGSQAIAEEDRMVFHLVLNLEVTVIDANHAEVRATTATMPGMRGSDGKDGWTNGISGVFPTLELHKRTAEGWKIASKRTSLAMRVRDKI